MPTRFMAVIRGVGKVHSNCSGSKRGHLILVSRNVEREEVRAALCVTGRSSGEGGVGVVITQMIPFGQMRNVHWGYGSI